MPARNLRGGKAYKKGKKVGVETEKVNRFYGKEDGQDYARVTKMLGNRRVLCFCNDGEERVCKIRGALCRGPNRQKIEIDDVVLISLRDFELSDSEPEVEATEGGARLASGRRQVADVIAKFDRSQWRDIRKEGGIHRLLFPNTTVAVVEDIFEAGGSDEESVEEQPTRAADVPMGGSGAGIIDGDLDIDAI